MDKISDDIMKKIVSLVEIAARNNIKIEQAFLFGSYAKGNSNKYSDFDIALVSEDFSGIRLDDNIRLMDTILAVDHRITTPGAPSNLGITYRCKSGAGKG